MGTFPRRAVVGLFLPLVMTTALAAASVVIADPGLPVAPCYNGLTPFNPYVDNCAIPQRPPNVVGGAPDQTALLNCSVGGQLLRALCLSQYVNGGPGYYP